MVALTSSSLVIFGMGRTIYSWILPNFLVSTILFCTLSSWSIPLGYSKNNSTGLWSDLPFCNVKMCIGDKCFFHHYVHYICSVGNVVRLVWKCRWLWRRQVDGRRSTLDCTSRARLCDRCYWLSGCPFYIYYCVVWFTCYLKTKFLHMSYCLRYFFRRNIARTSVRMSGLVLTLS